MQWWARSGAERLEGGGRALCYYWKEKTSIVISGILFIFSVEVYFSFLSFVECVTGCSVLRQCHWWLLVSLLGGQRSTFISETICHKQDVDCYICRFDVQDEIFTYIWRSTVLELGVLFNIYCSFFFHFQKWYLIAQCIYVYVLYCI